MRTSDAIAFDRLIRDFHESFRDPDPLTATRKRMYWEALAGCSFDRVAIGFQRCFEYGKYRGLPLPGDIRENMPAVQDDDTPLLEDDSKPDSQEESMRKYRFSQWCVGTGTIQRTGEEWRRNYDAYCRSGIDVQVKKVLDRGVPRNVRTDITRGFFTELKGIALPQGGGE